jgi:hypothetical protein
VLIYFFLPVKRQSPAFAEVFQLETPDIISGVQIVSVHRKKFVQGFNCRTSY